MVLRTRLLAPCRAPETRHQASAGRPVIKAMPPEIPGYYYDAARGKYFKIEASHTAPSAAAWSADAVRKRKAEDVARRAERQRAYKLRGHIRRHPLRRDIAASGLLLREVAAEPDWAQVDNRELAAAAWAGGVVSKGHIPFVPSFSSARYANLPCFYVGGHDTQTGLGVAYVNLDEETLTGSYISMDDNDCISFARERPGTLEQGLSFHTEMIRCPQMSSIKYHKPSHKMLLTSREAEYSCGLYFFSPPLSAVDDDQPQWLLGQTNHYQRLSIRHRLQDHWHVYKSTPAPANSDLICVIGTNAGIHCVCSNETIVWTAPQSTAGGVQPRDIFDQDFLQSNHNVLVAGGRQPWLWMTDLRTPESEWDHVPHASSIAHVRSVNPHQVLVAGLKDSMALYDLRFIGRHPTGAKPLLGFSAYRNDAYLDIGWDVSLDLGVVAAAQNDGTVKLFSLHSGRLLRGGAVDQIRCSTPIKALMFEQMPWEKTASLFAGEGPVLKKYSFGKRNLQDEA